MEIDESARRHGIADDDIEHAIRQALYEGDLPTEGPESLVLYLGPDRAANMLEVIVLEQDDESEVAIHAMRMRRKYAQLLRPTRWSHR